jgi:hypothetical protein
MSLSFNSGELNEFKGVKIFRGKLLKELSSATADAVNAVQNRAKEQIAKGPTRTGRTRSRRGRSAPSVASRKGEYPKGDTGTLGRSIMARYQPGTLHGTVGSHLKYSEILEGNDAEGKTADQIGPPWKNREHISRAGYEMRPFIQNLARQAMRNSARKARTR